MRSPERCPALVVCREVYTGHSPFATESNGAVQRNPLFPTFTQLEPAFERCADLERLIHRCAHSRTLAVQCPQLLRASQNAVRKLGVCGRVSGGVSIAPWLPAWSWRQVPGGGPPAAPGGEPAGGGTGWAGGPLSGDARTSLWCRLDLKLALSEQATNAFLPAAGYRYSV